MELIVTLSSISCLVLGLFSMSMIFSKNIMSKKPANMKFKDEKEYIKFKKVHYFANGLILIACSSITMFVTHHYFSIYVGIILMVFVNIKFQQKFKDISQINFQ